MARVSQEFFGNPGQRAMQRRAWSMWQLVGDDPAYCTHGRDIALASPHVAPLSRQIKMAREIGVGTCMQVPDADLADRFSTLGAAGLATDSYVDWRSSGETLVLARARLKGRPFADDLSLCLVDSHTSSEVMAGLDTVTQACEILLPMGPFIRGHTRPAVCAFVSDPSGRIVGASASVEMYHPASESPGLCWWGMLSTLSDRRGEGIASRLGAIVLDEMQRRHGSTRFF